MLFDQAHRFETVFPLRNHVDVWKRFQEEKQLLASGFLVVHNKRIDGHGEFASVSIGVRAAESQL